MRPKLPRKGSSLSFSGFVEIAPTCIRADKLTLREIRARVAGLENEQDAHLQAQQDEAAQNLMPTAGSNGSGCRGFT